MLHDSLRKYMLPKKHLAAAALLATAIVTGLLMSPSEQVEAQRIPLPLPFEDSSSLAVMASKIAGQSSKGDSGKANQPSSAFDTKPRLQWHQYTVRSGDSLSSLFQQAGFDDSLMFAVLNGESDGKALADLYVGQTGLATGPRLHYEFRVNDTPRNPETVRLPDANPIRHREKAAFDAQTSKLLSQLNTFEATTRIALNPPKEEAL